MKLFVIAALVGTLLFAFATFHPVRVCEQTQVKTTVQYHNNVGLATTDQPSLICYDSHL